MSDTPATPPPPPPSGGPAPQRRSLGVLNPNDKVDQLRQAFARDGVNPNTAAPVPNEAAKSPRRRELEGHLISALRTVYDPEIPVNVYDLGLIYGIDIAPDDAVHIRMTLTAPGCPVAGMIVADVERKVAGVDGVPGATVELVWDPPWDKGRMSEAALLELGLL